MNTKGGGWTIFQRRFDGSVDFSRKWEDYKFGFGQMDSEFWLGLKEIHRISNVDKNVLRVELENFEGKHMYAEYDMFRIGSESENYKLHVDFYSGA